MSTPLRLLTCGSANYSSTTDVRTKAPLAHLSSGTSSVAAGKFQARHKRLSLTAPLNGSTLIKILDPTRLTMQLRRTHHHWKVSMCRFKKNKQALKRSEDQTSCIRNTFRGPAHANGHDQRLRLAWPLETL